MRKDIGNLPTLLLAAHSYLDWLWYIDYKDNEAAEGSYEDYCAYKALMVSQFLQDLPHQTEMAAENYVTGMLDGYIQAMTE